MQSMIIKELARIAIMLPAFLLGLSVHEFFHALTETLLGDPTAKRQGRLTLNPIAHIDFLGLLCLLLVGFGWAKPVQFDQRNFKNPKLYSILTALAGPFSNFILALFALYCLKYIPLIGLSMPATITFNQFFTALAYVNVMLGVFNLLPIPPLDGSHILTVFTADKYPEFTAWIYRYSIFVLFFLLMIPQVLNFFNFLIIITLALLNSLVF